VVEDETVEILAKGKYIVTRFLVLTIASAAVSVSALNLLAPIAPPNPALGYNLVFHDEFHSLDLSPDGLGAHTWYEGVWFQARRAPLSNISASASALRLTWRRNQRTADTSITTLAHDKKSFHAWRYGYFEVRMRWDVVKGAWPALWLIPVEDATDNAVYNRVRQSGEIDIFEGQGDKGHDCYGTIHVWTNFKDSASKENIFRLPTSIAFSEYHTYGLLWIPGKVTWYFDDKPLHSETTPAVFDKQTYFLVLGMQEGVGWKSGVLAGVDSDEINMFVDWVRVWQ
jgi:hypothetical protein